MSKNGHDHNCDLGIEMMAYIYDELGQAERSRLETHIWDCAGCTDEFAEISHSRFSVYEWKRTEFDAIATPVFQIPVEGQVNQLPVDGWFTELRGLFSGWPVAVAFASVATVFIGVGLFALTNTGGNELGALSVPAIVTGSPTILTDPVPAMVDQKQAAPEKRASGTPHLDKVSPRSRTSQAKIVTKPQRAADTGSTRAVNEPVVKKPNLSNFEDVDDKTLRLSDLFDDGGV